MVASPAVSARLARVAPPGCEELPAARDARRGRSASLQTEGCPALPASARFVSGAQDAETAAHIDCKKSPAAGPARDTSGGRREPWRGVRGRGGVPWSCENPQKPASSTLRKPPYSRKTTPTGPRARAAAAATGRATAREARRRRRARTSDAAAAWSAARAAASTNTASSSE